MTSSSDETIQIYNVKEGRHEKSALSKKYGVKLARFTHTQSSIIYASTKQNSMASPSHRIATAFGHIC
jgi:COMPASS component SWD2